jgi:hypothetical protein
LFKKKLPRSIEQKSDLDILKKMWWTERRGRDGDMLKKSFGYILWRPPRVQYCFSSSLLLPTAKNNMRIMGWYAWSMQLELPRLCTVITIYQVNWWSSIPLILYYTRTINSLRTFVLGFNLLPFTFSYRDYDELFITRSSGTNRTVSLVVVCERRP